LQRFVQQSAPLWQVSPICWQNDAAWQEPFAAQNVEQHVDPCVHASPTPRQLPLMATQVPPPAASDSQRPLQQSTLPEHVFPTCVQPLAAQDPLEQVPLQQSLACAHAAPRFRQTVPESCCANRPESGSVPPLDAPDVPLDAPDVPLDAPDVPLDAPPPEEPPLDPPLDPPLVPDEEAPAASFPLDASSDDAPLEEAPLEPVGIVPSTDPSPPDEAPPEDAPPIPLDANASLPASAPPSEEPIASVELLAPQPADATHTLSAAIEVRPQRRRVLVIVE
jgi:type VI secretion system secreted protein VgrG